MEQDLRCAEKQGGILRRQKSPLSGSSCTWCGTGGLDAKGIIRRRGEYGTIMTLTEEKPN